MYINLANAEEPIQCRYLGEQLQWEPQVELWVGEPEARALELLTLCPLYFKAHSHKSFLKIVCTSDTDYSTENGRPLDMSFSQERKVHRMSSMGTCGLARGLDTDRYSRS